VLNIPDDFLVVWCGGQWGNASATDLGAIVKKYLYQYPQDIHERRMALGVQLVQIMERQFNESN
jgi:hypothetical protein